MFMPTEKDETSIDNSSNMKNIKNLIIVITLVNICFPDFVYAKKLVPAPPEDSLVVVTSSSPMGKRGGSGFMIGDGSLVVTAYHLVFEGSEQGQHEMAGLVTIFSPYLGDAADSEIVVADKQLDLAVLKVPWKGHPALEFADANSIILAQHMEIIGIPLIIKHLHPGANPVLDKSFDVQRENLPIDYVAVLQQTPKFIALSGVGQLGPGWSGSPMLLPSTSRVAGCFVRLHRTKGQQQRTSQGPAITHIKHLLYNVGETKLLNHAESNLPKPKDGFDVFNLFLQAYSYYVANEYELASKHIQSVLQLRPESAFAYVLAASITEEMGKYEQAGQYYQKALKLNPEGPQLKIMFAQYLSEREPDKALEVLQNLWQFDKLKPYVAGLMFNILAERGEFQRCSELLSEALKLNSNNAYFWLNLGACYSHLGNLDNAVGPMTKAVNLMPERGPFRGQLAKVLEKAGRFDEAEKHFRKLLEMEPDNPVVHMWLAKFLSKHRPSANKEAIKEAQTALELPAKRGLSKQAIEQFIQDN